MKKYIPLLILALLLAASAEEQKDVLKIKTRYGFEVERRPFVNFNIFTDYRNDDKRPRLFLALEVQNDRLQFVKQDGQYRADYQISVAIIKDKIAVFKETWDEIVRLADFEETNAKDQYQYKVYPLSQMDDSTGLAPGAYECFFEIRDFTSKNVYNNSRKFTINPYQDRKILTTEIAFLKNDEKYSADFPLSPAPKGLLYAEPYTAYMKIIADSVAELKINARLLRDDGNGFQLYYQKYLTLQPDSGVFYVNFPLPEDSLGEGSYQLRFIGMADGEEINREQEFSIHWFGKSTYLYKADLAIRPMQYLLSPEEYKKVKDQNYDDLDRWIKNYWKTQDPTPETKFNELLDIFFKRVQDANEKFSQRHKEGWETDQGKILILYGTPDEIENRRYETDLKPHVVWKYKKQNLIFVFVDDKRDGEFRLLNEEVKE